MFSILKHFVLLAAVWGFWGASFCLAADFSTAAIMNDLRTIEAAVMTGPDGRLLINKGGADSVRRGDLWTIHEKGEIITDPVSGEELGRLDTLVATVRVVRADKRFSEIVSADQGPEKIRTNQQALRYDGIKARFVDSSGRHFALYEKLRLGLPALSWQGYEKIGPEAIPSAPADTLIVMAGPERLTIWCGGEILKIYENEASSSAPTAGRTGPVTVAPVAAIPLRLGGGQEAPEIIRPRSAVPARTVLSPVPGLMTPGMTSKIGGQLYRPVGSLETIIRNLDMAEFDQSSTPWFVYLDDQGLAVQPAIGRGERYLYKYAGFGEVANISVGGDGMIAMNIFHQSEWRMCSRLLRFRAGHFETMASDINYILAYIDVDGDGSKELVGQNFDKEDFFGAGVYVMQRRGKQLSRGKELTVGPRFRLFGAFWADLDGNRSMETGFFDLARYLQIRSKGREVWRSTDVFGGSIADVEIENIESEGATSRREIIWAPPAVIPYDKGRFVALAANDPSLLNMIGGGPRNGGIRILYEAEGHYFLRHLDAKFDGPVQAVFAWGDELYCAVVEGNIFTGKGRTHVVAFSLEELQKALTES